MHSQFDCIVSDANYLCVTSSINVTKNVVASSTPGCFCFTTRHYRMCIITRWQVREFWTMLSRDLRSRYTGSCLLAARRWFSRDAIQSYVCLSSVSAETEMSRKLPCRCVLLICHSSLVWRGSLQTGWSCCGMLDSPVPLSAVKLVLGWTLDRHSLFPVYMTPKLFQFNYLGEDKPKLIKTMIWNSVLFFPSKHQPILVAVVKLH